MKTPMLLVAAAVLMSPAAMAADLIAPAAAPTAAAPTGGNWDGAYIGATIGYGWGTATNDGTDADPIQGAFAGGQIGYNFHLTDGVVLGVQGDLNWNDEQGNYPSDPTETSSRINWDGAVVGRVGLDAGALLPYLEAGVAIANETEQYGTAIIPLDFAGWTVGGGLELKVTENISANLEYRYADYGTQNLLSPQCCTVNLTNNTVRTGLNFHF